MRGFLVAVLCVMFVFTAGVAAQAGLKDGSPLAGKVVETMNSGGYTYVLLESNGEKAWAAMPTSKIKVGQSLKLQAGAKMEDFYSKTLKRTFKVIYFSDGIAK
ncbi:MAG: hypothetical protein RBT37_09045 [Dissulfurispiraceae bacterium]|jgi:hypothetical protein|nr:hypothetical protein [Dissulfurispiraceae bacterium]